MDAHNPSAGMTRIRFSGWRFASQPLTGTPLRAQNLGDRHYGRKSAPSCAGVAENCLKLASIVLALCLKVILVCIFFNSIIAWQAKNDIFGICPKIKQYKETSMAIVQQIKDYQPTKVTLLWSMAGAAALTMFVGFTWGGWVTGGTAATMAQKAAEESTAKLAAVVCVERFVNAPDFATQLVALKETSRWQQRRFVEEGNWATLSGMDKAVDGAASLCAEQLADMELPTMTDTTSNTGTAVQ